ncbi:HpcH/HpaI aldolase/citrate lyase family protein [Corynebacterium pseudopelargi]|uniref:Citrate lyase subunit beta-like protein n=1 Tax=Corynebacterium pseudopelargi TaxID=2080757 RepID=A0A3G6IVE1_9CORY|nr:CoA ester lyase [Corynebacterium pseudopelargi]AZA09682.1 Citrate lyase subunit beta-like protein [Corynebacterium pseudopelargi]
MSFAIPGPALLFAPANRAEVIPKAAAQADMVILDLEDGAGNLDRQQAYQNIREAGLDPATTIVRTVGPSDEHFEEDIEFVRSTEYRTVMLPKVYEQIPEGLDEFHVIAMIETPLAVVHLQDIATHPNVVGLFWGAEDLTTMLGGTHSRYLDDEPHRLAYRDTMRTTRALMHIHAAAAGKISIDAVHADFHDEAGQFEEAVDAARSGFAATACIHPKQIAVVRRAYAPEPQQVQWAQRVVEKASQYPGAFKLDGEMVDAPLIAQAERVLERANLNS